MTKTYDAAKPANHQHLCAQSEQSDGWETRLVPRGVLAFSLLGDVEAEVLQQDDGSGGGVSAGGFHLRTHAVLQEGDVPAEAQRGPVRTVCACNYF